VVSAVIIWSVLMVGGRLGLSRRRNDVGRRGFNPQSGIYGPMSESID
jgi:hypothetical protein